MGDEEARAFMERREYDRKHKIVLDQAFEANAETLTWVWEFFPEPMPLENKYGTSFNHLLASMTPKGKVEGYQDNPLTQPAPAEDVLVFSDSYGFARNILKYAPTDRLGKVKIVSSKPGDLDADKIKELMDPRWDLVIMGYPIDIPTSNDVDEIHKAQNELFNFMMLLGKHIQNNMSAQRMVFLSCDLFADDPEIHEEVGRSLVAYGGLTGFVNTLRQEIMCKVMHVDTEWSLPETSMPLLSSECFRHATFGLNIVRILKNGRYVQRLVPSLPFENQKEYKIPTEGVFIVTGGSGATAQVLCKWIFDRAGEQKKDLSGLKVICASRSAGVSGINVPFYEQAKQAADARGGQLLHVKCDAGSRDDIVSIIKEHTPNIVGIIHTAGALFDALLSKIDWEGFEKSWDPKSRSALYIDDALQHNDNPRLELFLMFSSLSVSGSPGQLNYSSSNAYQDALARHRVAMGKPGLAIQWTTWSEVGMYLTLEKKFQERIQMAPIALITNEQGITAVERAISSGLPYLQGSPVNFPVMLYAYSQEPATHGFGRLQYSAFMPFAKLYKDIPETVYVSYSAQRDNNAKFLGYTKEDGLLYKQFVKCRDPFFEDDDDD